MAWERIDRETSFKNYEKDTRKESEKFQGWGHCFHAAGRPKWLIPRSY